MLARQDLKEIARYTLLTWGVRQLRRYLAELERTIRQLEHEPERAGQDRSSLREGLRSLSHQKQHLIFFRVTGRTVEIIRVLHHRRDWMSLIRPL